MVSAPNCTHSLSKTQTYNSVQYHSATRAAANSAWPYHPKSALHTKPVRQGYNLPPAPLQRLLMLQV
eukprot:266015-Rhodomonas_salina.1